MHNYGTCRIKKTKAAAKEVLGGESLFHLVGREGYGEQECPRREMQ
jgi:hypothetical protein